MDAGTFRKLWVKAVMPLVLGCRRQAEVSYPWCVSVVLPTPAPPPQDSEDGASPGAVNARPGAAWAPDERLCPPRREVSAATRRDPAQPLRPRYPEALPPRRGTRCRTTIAPALPGGAPQQISREFDSIK